MKPDLALTLAVQGTSRGFGFVVMEGPFKAHDWGTVGVKGDRNAACLAKLKLIVERYEPVELLLEAQANSHAPKSERIAAFYRDARTLALVRGIAVHAYSFKEVQACFRQVGAETRDEIAAAVARSVAALAAHVPRPREAWDGDHRRMPVFSAAAIVLTHYQVAGRQLLEDLKP